MLSVLIPTYNWNALQLVRKVQTLLEKEGCLYEILVLDDASKSQLNVFNKEINQLPNCSFNEVSVNLGRSKIRNVLAEKAAYDWLLFLDADVDPVCDNFIGMYLSEINKGKEVVVGGISYNSKEERKNLRWKQGKKSEEKEIQERIRFPYKYFFTANFLIKKELFSQFCFDESLVGYGYEDLIFSKQLEAKNIKVWQISNKVYHLGIDENSVFVAKTKEALSNLVVLFREKKLTKNDVKLILIYDKLQVFGVISFLSAFSEYFEIKAVKTSSLLYFNLFRLTYLHKIIKNTL